MNPPWISWFWLSCPTKNAITRLSSIHLLLFSKLSIYHGVADKIRWVPKFIDAISGEIEEFKTGRAGPSDGVQI